MHRLFYVLTLLAFASIACNLGAVVPTSTPMPTPTTGAVATSLPTVAPTIAPTIAPTKPLASGNPTSIPVVYTPVLGCPANWSPRLVIGGSGRVTPGQPNALRTQPTRNNQISVVIGEIPAGGTFAVLGGPICDGGYPSWEIRYNGAIGWAAATANTTY